MAAQKNKKHSINLLPQEEFESSTLGRILKWALSTFRVIVIITEIVVVGAFLSRFWLDARIADLNDAIKQREAVVLASSEFEQEFRNTQEQLRIFSEIADNPSAPGSVLETVSSYLPNDIFLTAFSFLEKEARISGISASERGIAVLIANLEQIEEFEDISLTQLDSVEGEVSQLEFTIRIKLQ